MTYVSGVLYYLSTCINPLLYNLMSNKFREAFRVSEELFQNYSLYYSLSLYLPVGRAAGQEVFEGLA